MGRRRFRPPRTNFLPARLATATTASAFAPATAAGATVPIESAAATAALFPRSRFVHIETAPVDVPAVQTRDRLRRVGGVGHLHKRKAARLAGLTVAHKTDPLHRFISAEGSFQVALGCCIREVTNKNIRHSDL